MEHGSDAIQCVSGGLGFTVYRLGFRLAIVFRV
jgi:hypothetical protein